MIKPEQVPDAAEEAMRAAFYAAGTLDTMWKEAITAVLNAWPGVRPYKRVGIILPLTERSRTMIKPEQVPGNVTEEHYVDQVEKLLGSLVPPHLYALARRGAQAIADNQCKKEPKPPTFVWPKGAPEDGR